MSKFFGLPILKYVVFHIVSVAWVEWTLEYGWSGCPKTKSTSQREVLYRGIDEA